MKRRTHSPTDTRVLISGPRDEGEGLLALRDNNMGKFNLI